MSSEARSRVCSSWGGNGRGGEGGGEGGGRGGKGEERRRGGEGRGGEGRKEGREGGVMLSQKVPSFMSQLAMALQLYVCQGTTGVIFFTTVKLVTVYSQSLIWVVH